MASFLFTTLPSNDLGLLTRSLPVARELRELGHEVVFCSPGRAPRTVLRDAGFARRAPDDPRYNLSDPSSLLRLARAPRLWPDLARALRLIGRMVRSSTAEIWNVDHFLANVGMGDVALLRAGVASLARLIRDIRPDAVVDFWNPIACIAAQATGTPLAGVLQADQHPDGGGFIWWRDPPSGLPTVLPAVNQVLRELGLPTVERTADVLTGDLTLVLGIPETDPLPARAAVRYVGAILWQKPGSTLPEPFPGADDDRPLVWVYPGNMRYVPGAPSPFDSLVVLEACVEALGGEPVRVVLTTGHQQLPRRFRRLPPNFTYAPFLPGLALAERSALLIHHGGYGSCQTGLWAGRPAVIVPTYSERESNARRVAAAGAGLVVLPNTNTRGTRKRVPPGELREAVRTVLSNPAYRANAERLSRDLRGQGGAALAARLIVEATAPAPH